MSCAALPHPPRPPAAGAVLALLVKLHGGVHKQGAQVGAADADGHLGKVMRKEMVKPG